MKQSDNKEQNREKKSNRYIFLHNMLFYVQKSRTFAPRKH